MIENKRVGSARACCLAGRIEVPKVDDGKFSGGTLKTVKVSSAFILDRQASARRNSTSMRTWSSAPRVTLKAVTPELLESCAPFSTLHDCFHKGEKAIPIFIRGQLTDFFLRG